MNQLRFVIGNSRKVTQYFMTIYIYTIVILDPAECEHICVKVMGRHFNNNSRFLVDSLSFIGCRRCTDSWDDFVADTYTRLPPPECTNLLVRSLAHWKLNKVTTNFPRVVYIFIKDLVFKLHEWTRHVCRKLSCT